MNFADINIGLAIAISSAFYGIVTCYGLMHLPEIYKDELKLWIWGDYESTWSKQFCRMFDVIFGERNLSKRCFFISSIFSIITVSVFYLFFEFTFSLSNNENRMGGSLTLSQTIFFGVILNMHQSVFGIELNWPM